MSEKKCSVPEYSKPATGITEDIARSAMVVIICDVKQLEIVEALLKLGTRKDIAVTMQPLFPFTSRLSLESCIGKGFLILTCYGKVDNANAPSGMLKQQLNSCVELHVSSPRMLS